MNVRWVSTGGMFAKSEEFHLRAETTYHGRDRTAEGTRAVAYKMNGRCACIRVHTRQGVHTPREHRLQAG